MPCRGSGANAQPGLGRRAGPAHVECRRCTGSCASRRSATRSARARVAAGAGQPPPDRALGEARVASADVVTVVNDGVASWDDGARFGSLAVAVRSKADLGGEHGAALPTSAATGQELEPLRRRALAVAGVADPVRRGTSRHSSPRRGQQALAAAVRDHFAAAGSSAGSTSDGCLAPRRNCASPSRADEVKDGRSPPLAARAQRRVLDVVEHGGSHLMTRVRES